ncbi:MAG: ATP-binding protein [Bacteroidaceae bacterium]|nr:ATP-binding protein [Bacteroidaceae bacterium]
MVRLNNPFPVEGYAGDDYFCDREQETRELLAALENERDVTLISPRRMGKSGLIKHAFERAGREHPEVSCFYIDIYHTQCLNDLIQLLAAHVVGAFDTNVEKMWSTVMSVFKSSRPTLTPDAQTGVPTLSLDFVPGKEEHTLKEIFTYLQQSGKRCYIAIDEFQQVAEYPEKGTEALLRSYIQFTPNVSFIFSGSKKHLMQEMFSSPARPFFQSTQTLSLKEIDETAYCRFAQQHFTDSGRNLPMECFHRIYTTVQAHTWYIQMWLNKLYDISQGDVTEEMVEAALQKILREEDDNFDAYHRLMTAAQRKIMLAIAREGVVSQPYAAAFIKRYNLPAVSTVKSSLKTLVDNEFLLSERGAISVYNRFFGLWLCSTFATR